MAEQSEQLTTLHPSMVLGAFAEGILSGRRVALLGDGSTGLAERLAAASGRRVQAYDPDPVRTAESIARAGAGGRSKVSHVVLEDGLELSAGAFDAVVIADLHAFGGSAFDSPAQLLALAAAILARRGIVVLASANPARADAGQAIGYYELYDLVGEVFAEVKMLGQAPFAAFTVADFAATGEPGVTIDSSLLNDATEEPTHFIVVASQQQQDLQIDPYMVVQVPAEQGVGWLASNTAAAGQVDAAARAEADAAALAEAKLQRSVIAAELDTSREREQEARRIAKERKRTSTKLSARVAELQAQVEELEQKRRREAQALERAQASFEQQREADLEGFQEELDSMLERIAELEERAERAQSEPPTAPPPASSPAAAPGDDAQIDGDGQPLEQAAPPTETGADAQVVRHYTFQIAELRKALATVRAECDSLRGQAARVDELTAELDQVRQQLAAGEQASTTADEDAEHAAEVAALEDKLKEQGGSITSLREHLRLAQRVGRELLHKLSSAQQRAQQERAELASAAREDQSNGRPHATQTAATPEAAVDGNLGGLRAQLEALQVQCARQLADIEAAGWKIAAQERQLLESGSAESADSAALEHALRVAQEEIAQLRRKTTDG